MKHLIIYSHPNPQSFNHAILETYIDAVRARGDEGQVRDLYQLNFQPVLSAEDLAGFSEGKIAPEIVTEQEFVAWADLITFIYPLWWAGMPAIAKGYIDRVFCDGFAYRFGPDGLEPLLKGKKAMTITTLGDTSENYEKQGFFEAMDKLTDGISFAFSGLHSIDHIYFGAVPLVSHEERRAMLNEVKTIVSQLES